MANQKLTDLAAAGLPLQSSDLFYVVQNVGSSPPVPTDQKIAFSDLLTQIPSAGGLTLIEKKLVTANSTTITFNTGIDGNTDEVYLLEGRIVCSATNPVYGWLPNNLTTNLQSQKTNFFGGNNQNNSESTTVLLLGQGNAAGDYLDFAINIHAKKDPNSQAVPLTYSGHAGGIFTTGTNQFAGAVGGVWQETSVNLTSIVISSSVASGIGNGSTFALYKYTQS